jgi:hypothetical protein
MVTLICVPILAANAQDPELTVKDQTPKTSFNLPTGQALYFRIAYDSSKPLRMQAKGYYHNEPAQGIYFNASPVYPAGQGEALVWIAGDTDFAEVDEIRITATNYLDRKSVV